MTKEVLPDVDVSRQWPDTGRNQVAQQEGDREGGLASVSTQRIPTLPATYLPRTRLSDELEAAASGAVTLLVAPAGAGKTLGVAGWLHHTGQAQRAIWIRADRSCAPDQLAALLRRAASGSAASRESGSAERPNPVVLDNAQDLPAATIRFLDQWINDEPQGIRVLLLSRRDLPLTGLIPQMLGEVNVIRGDVLALTRAEVTRLVLDLARTDSTFVAKTIADRSEGWCAVAVLMARAVGASWDKEAAARRFESTGPPALDRVAGEVFATLRPRERHLLLCASAEPSLTAETARDLTRDSHAAEVLADLETTGLLVTSHVPPAPQSAEEGTAQPTYTVHPILREVARRRLQAGGVDVQRARSTVTHAVDHDLLHGRSDDRALARLAAVGAHTQAARLIAAHGSGMVLRGHGDLVQSFARAHPEVIESEPDTWKALALDRWIQADVAAARRWIDRIAHRGPGSVSTVPDACMGLLRARAGLDPLEPAIDRAVEVLRHPQEDPGVHHLLPLLVLELGACETWTGDLSSARVHLSTAATMGRVEGLPAVTARALSQLALVELNLGREQGSATLAADAITELRKHSLEMPTTRERAELVLDFGQLQRPPWPRDERGRDRRARILNLENQERVVDPATRVWARIAEARHLLLDGRLLEAERTLEMPFPSTPLPAHLHVAVLLERALQAVVAVDASSLAAVADALADAAGRAEASLARGLRADMLGDLSRSIELLQTAGNTASVAQPPVGPIADVASAQLLAARGATDEAFTALRRALSATEVRANAMPFLGWSRHGVSVGWLLEGMLTSQAATPWARQLAETLDHHTDVTHHLRMVTATPRERIDVADPRMMPQLSPRERVVLHELARGSSYADMADDLLISANTVKSHVKSLYEKLGVNRRSAALAVARSRHLL